MIRHDIYRCEYVAYGVAFTEEHLEWKPALWDTVLLLDVAEEFDRWMTELDGGRSG